MCRVDEKGGKSGRVDVVFGIWVCVQLSISEGKKITLRKRADGGKPQEKRKSELKYKDQSVTFFLPVFCTHED